MHQFIGLYKMTVYHFGKKTKKIVETTDLPTAEKIAAYYADCDSTLGKEGFLGGVSVNSQFYKLKIDDDVRTACIDNGVYTALERDEYGTIISSTATWADFFTFHDINGDDYMYLAQRESDVNWKALPDAVFRAVLNAFNGGTTFVLGKDYNDLLLTRVVDEI